MQFRSISLQKNLCLLGVVLLHAMLPFAEPGRFWQMFAPERSVFVTRATSFLDLFLVPSFFFASGFLAAMSEERRRRGVFEQLKNRGLRLLRPWFFTTLVWLAPLYAFFDLPAFNRPLHAGLVETYGLALRGLFTAHLWFLLVLFWTTAFWIVLLPLVRKLPFPDLAGGLIAICAALGMQLHGGGLTWFCLWKTNSSLIYFYLGLLAYRHREALDAFLLRRPLLTPCLFVACAAVFSGKLPFYGHWALSCLSCFFSYSLSLWATHNNLPIFQTKLFHRLEVDAFRYYLLHLPPALVLFKLVNNAFPLWPVGLQIALIFLGTLAVTGVVVAASRGLETLFLINEPTYRTPA